jgi:hypothetical protein
MTKRNHLFIILTICVLGLIFPTAKAQSISTLSPSYDSLAEDSLAEDSLSFVKTIHSLEQELQMCSHKFDSLYNNWIQCQTYSASKDTVLCQQVESIEKLENDIRSMSNSVKYLNQLKDSLIFANDAYQVELQNKNALLEDKIKAFQEKESLFIEKENLYKDALANSNVSTAKLEGQIHAKDVSISAKNTEIDYLQRSINEKEETLKLQKDSYVKLSLEKERYRHLADSLRERIAEADKKIIQTNEQLKYTEQRAKDAEAKIAAATSRKKKVSAIQGIAMKTFRTPDWSTRPVQQTQADGSVKTVYEIVNRNSGSVEFDYITGAFVMLWDLSRKDKNKTPGNKKEIKKFDQDFSYSLGVYVGFGGSNLFKNFYAGPTFKFLDFFHFSTGVNVCEYEVLNANVHEGDVLPSGWSIADQVSKSWKVKPFISLSLDLDFISFMKK